MLVPPSLRDDLARAVPTDWVRSGEPPAVDGPHGEREVPEAVDRWRRFAPVLSALFSAELADGVVESELVPVPNLAARFAHPAAPSDLAHRIYVKADHALPLAGSIKARGGLYAVLCIAERTALEAGLLRSGGDYAVLTSAAAKDLFSRRRIIVGSTGNLGFAIGLVGRALGFNITVHMSHDAKAWKKNRLTALGATVVEHRSDYSQAVAAARDAAQQAKDAYFIDDERSPDLFFGYSACAPRLIEQLRTWGVTVDAAHPLCLYLPCGVGGAPAGVLFGLRTLLGRHVWGFFAEPTASPCMLMRLAGAPAAASVYDLGLDNRTIADGLAVACASEFAFRAVGSQVMGAYTVSDEQMLAWVAAAHREQGLRLEPSAAVGFPGALTRAWSLPAYAPLRARMAAGTHVIWTTGGRLLPDEEFAALLARAAAVPPPG